MQKAAEKLDELAKQTNPQADAKSNEASPKQSAQDLAKQQRDLAKATQQARENAGKIPGEEGKKAQQQALEQFAEKQRELNQQASLTPANQNQKALEQAR